MTEINVSAHTAYHTQVNNRYYPLSSCNTTSAIMWLLDCGIPFPPTGELQPEDYLTALSETPEAYEYMAQAAPWALRDGRPVFPPRQVHVCLDWAINRFVGKEVVRFRTDMTYQELVAELAAGRALMLSTLLTAKGHIVVLVGVRTEQTREELADPARVRIDQIKGWIVDDPYGNYYRGYQDQRGNDVCFLPDDFDRLTRELYRNRKWAHVRMG